MEVEVVLRQIRERRHREVDAVSSSHRERVTRHLHRHRGGAPLAHHRKQRLYVRRLGCRESGLDGLVADECGDRADQPAHHPRRGQPGPYQVGGRGLAARARDSEHRHGPARPAVDLGRHRAQPGPHVVDHYDRYARRHEQQAVAVGEHRDRTPGGRGRGEPGTVRRASGQAGEQVAGADPAAARRDTADRHVCTDQPTAGEGGQRAETLRLDLPRPRQGLAALRHVSTRYWGCSALLPRHTPAAGRVGIASRSAGCARAATRRSRSRGTAARQRHRPRDRVPGCRS